MPCVVRWSCPHICRCRRQFVPSCEVRPMPSNSQGELSMAAGAQVKSDFDGPEDRQLADDIARAMHHRPLMSRLQRVEVMHGNAAGAVAKSATRLAPVPSAPAPAQASPPPIPVDPRSLDEVIDDLGHFAAPPPSTEWLEKAQREHRRERSAQCLGLADDAGDRRHDRRRRLPAAARLTLTAEIPYRD